MKPLATRIEEFLDAHHVMSLATVGDSGAHAASVMYARDGFALCWTSDAKSRHSQHVERDARVTVTIAPDYTDFRVIRGLQIAGRAVRLEAADAERTRLVLARRYPFLADPALRTALEKSAFYQLLPRSITLIDNAVAFGHRETLELAN